MTQYLEELVQKISTKADLKGFDELDKKQKRARKQNDLLAKSFRRAFGIFLSIQGVRSIVETSRKFDLMQKSIKGLTKSADDFQYLRKEAYRTGTDLMNIAESYKNFYSAASGVGFGKGAIQSMFSDVLVAGRGIGASQSQIHSALVALEQMISKGKVSAQELRLQMGNALPGAFEIAARAMNMTTQELDELMSKGQLASTVFVPKFTAQLKKELGQGFEANIKSLDFALVNLSTAWQEFQAEILHGEAGEALADLVKQITSILRSSTLLTTLRLVGKALAFIIKNLKWIMIFWSFNKIMQITQAVMRLHKEILLTAKSTAALGAVTRTLASGYALLTSGQVIKGLNLIRGALWAMVTPTLILSAKIALIMAGILMLQDLLLTLTDPSADTYTRDLINGYNTYKATRGTTPDSLLQDFQNEYGSVRYTPEGNLAEYLPSAIPTNTGSIMYTGNKNNNSAQTNNISFNIYQAPGQNEKSLTDEIYSKLGDVLDDYRRTGGN